MTAGIQALQEVQRWPSVKHEALRLPLWTWSLLPCSFTKKDKQFAVCSTETHFFEQLA